MSLREQYVQQLRSLPMKNTDDLAVSWESPSNIALVKYWGKHGNQLPMNPSLSITLSACKTTTTMSISKKNAISNAVELEFYFEGKPAPAFGKRVKTFLDSVLDLCPWLVQYDIKIDSSNSFPHSAGIASSASAFSALALCLMSLEDLIYEDLHDDETFRQKSSFLARLGSGSACRSIHEKAGWWGKSDALEDGSDEFAVSCAHLLHPIFEDFQDSVLLASREEKPVSSSAGHHMMAFHPYRDARMDQVDRHLMEIKSALQTGDVEKFGQVLEQEALCLHALMLSSSPGYFLVNGNSIKIIDAIRRFREETKTPCYFTIDAGPNIHLLYPASEKSAVHAFIDEQLCEFIEGVIHDKMGNGPVQLM